MKLAEVWERVRGVRLLPLAIGIALITATFPLRTIRWRYLLRLEGETLPFVPLWHATAIGFMAINLLPARAGEFARAYAARQLTGTRFTTAFASIAVERVLDGVTLVALMVVAIWSGGFRTDTPLGAATLGEIASGAAVLFVSVLVLFSLAVHRPAPALRLTRTLSRKLLPVKWANRLIDAAEGLLSGMDALRSPSRIAAVTFWSLMVWLTGWASFVFAFAAFDIDVPWSAALLLQSLVAFGVAVQFSPGFFGQYEAMIRLTLALYAVSTEKAVSLAFGFHLGAFVPITLLGLYSLSRAHLHLADLKKGGRTGTEGDE